MADEDFVNYAPWPKNIDPVIKGKCLMLNIIITDMRELPIEAMPLDFHDILAPFMITLKGNVSQSDAVHFDGRHFSSAKTALSYYVWWKTRGLAQMLIAA